MKKKLLVILAAAVSCIFMLSGLAACGDTNANNPDENAHEHTYSTAWTSDETYHWHAATCGHTDEVSGKTEHSFADGVCSVCGYKQSEPPVQQHEHTYSDAWTSDGTYHWHAATCGHTDEVTGKAEHTWDDGVITTNPTCTEAGVKTYTCTVCEATKPETIPAAGHTYSEEWTSDGTYHWHAATCGHTAEVSDKAEHDYVDGVCSVCEFKKELKFTLSDDGTYYIVTGLGDYTDTDVVIPASRDNLPVKAVGDFAFYGGSTLTSVIIPDSVESIGRSAFKNCSSLGSITIGAGVTSIGNNAFENCAALTEIDYNATACEDLLSDNYVFSGAGQSGDGITLNIGANVTKIPAYMIYTKSTTFSSPDIVTVSFAADSACESIGNYAFGHCGSIAGSITIPDSVESIGNYAFSYCISLGSVTIGAGVTSIGNNAFENCNALTEINYNATACQNLMSSAGVFSEAGQSGTGITVNIGANVTKIPNNLFRNGSVLSPHKITAVRFAENGVCESIGDYAFYLCLSLTNITIPDSVTSIGVSAFNDCRALNSVTIGAGVTSIGNDAFRNCYRLVEVYDLSPSVTITKGSMDNGRIGYYALDIYTSASAKSKLSTSGDGYVFYENGSTVYLIGYNGTDTELTLPDLFNNKNYAIHDSAFIWCISLTGITIPEGVTSIGDSAFHGCSKLESITIPDSVTSIGNQAFYSCSSLESIIIGAGVTNIGNQAFVSCSSFTSAIFRNTSGWSYFDWGTSTDGTSVSEEELSDPSTAAGLLTSHSYGCYWQRV